MVKGARASAQTGVADEGALFLLLPTGARAVGMGRAVAADKTLGSEAVWWNPAGLAQLEKREAAIHHSQSIIGTGDAITLLIPSSLLGVLAASVNQLDFGEQDVTEPGQPPGTEPIGTLTQRSLVFAATYATAFGKRISAGLTYKVVQFRRDCTGTCPQDADLSATTSALDFGAQFEPFPHIPIVIGVSARNVGLRFQINDSPQSDPLPRRLEVGVLYHSALPSTLVRDTEVRVAVDLLDHLQVRDPTPSMGIDVVYQKRAHLRAGYVFESDVSSGGPSFGLGLETGSLSFDFARVFAGLSADAGRSPTYLSLRYLF
jgi:hypothetical protein